MTTLFAALEARVNNTALTRLANVEALLDGVAVTGVFNNGAVISQGGVGMVTSEPTFRLATSAVPADWDGKALVINSVAYTIAGHDPDGTGISVLTLEFA